MYFGFTKPPKNSNKSKKYKTEFSINHTANYFRGLQIIYFFQ